MDPNSLPPSLSDENSEILREMCMKLQKQGENHIEEDMCVLEKQAPVPKMEMSAMDDDQQTEGSSTNPAHIEDEITELKKNCTFLSHQLNMIMSALHVRPCTCETCAVRADAIRKKEMETQQDMIKSIMERQRKQMEEQQKQIQQNRPPMQAPPLSNNNGGLSNVQNIILAEEMKKENGEKMDPEEAMSQQLLQQLFNPEALAQFANMQEMQRQMGGGPMMMNNGLQDSPQRGRRSKYCTPEEKKAVAEYAQTHGAAAAARKFGIPPPVAAYYQRKESRHQQKVAHAQALIAAGVPASALPSGMNLPQNGLGQNNAALLNSLSLPATPATPISPDNEMDMELSGGGAVVNPVEMQFKMHANPAHSGSPGFLRGRGRGRPKLIGDELDAELVEYMVKLKTTDPNCHLTASRALDIARQYIMTKAPGLLEEHGGQVKLKLTWAMKLVQRVAERQKEIELGLPAGTLSSLGKTVQMFGTGVTSMNNITELMAQNMLSQNMQNIFGSMQQPGCTPEIINGKEIDLTALLNGQFGSMDNDDGDDDDVIEEQNEGGMEPAESPESSEHTGEGENIPEGHGVVDHLGEIKMDGQSSGAQPTQFIFAS